MKYWTMLLLVAYLGSSAVFAGSISEDELERLQRSVKIGGVSDDTEEVEEDDEEQELEVLKFYTNQHQDDAEKYEFRVKVVAELTDKKAKKVYIAKMAGLQGAVGSEYTGEDTWKFMVPYADMKRPKYTAYVIQYGILDGNEFIVLAEETDDVDTLEELEARTTEMVPEKAVLFHQYSFLADTGEGEEVQQSMWTKLK